MKQGKEGRKGVEGEVDPCNLRPLLREIEKEREREEILDFKLNEALLFPIGVSGFQNSWDILAPV